MYTRCGQQFLLIPMCQPSGVRRYTVWPAAIIARLPERNASFSWLIGFRRPARTTKARTTMCGKTLRSS